MSSAVRVGELIGDRYQVHGELGAGGMGVVYEALHLKLGQRVAIKVLLEELCGDPEAIARFVREARAMVKIESEHVARVTDVGTLATGEPFIVMEYLEGKDLAALLEQSGPLSIEDAVTYLLQASEAIAEAHSVGVIHRDLKPSNLFLARRRDGSQVVKVLDFGISKVAPAVPFGRTSTRTATTVVLGSPLYMSPEQVRSSKSVDPRSDVWSLGVLLHELLTGTSPFMSDTLPGLLAKIVADPPTPLRGALPEAPADLEAAILRCLAKDPNERFQSVRAFAAALEPFAPKAVKSRFARTLFGVHEDDPPRLTPLPASDRDPPRRSAATLEPPAQGGALPVSGPMKQVFTRSRRGSWAIAAAGLATFVFLALAVWLVVAGGSAPASDGAGERRRSAEHKPAAQAAAGTSADSPRTGTTPPERLTPIVTPLDSARWSSLLEARMNDSRRLLAARVTSEERLFDARE